MLVIMQAVPDPEQLAGVVGPQLFNCFPVFLYLSTNRLDVNLHHEILMCLVPQTSMRFFQIIEGPDEVVGETFERIRLDKRHFDVRLRHSGEIRARAFQDWSVGFAARAYLPVSEPLHLDFDSASVEQIIHRGQILRRHGVIAEAGLESPSVSGP